LEIRFLGHSAFEIRLASGKSLAVDPYLSENPRAAAKPEDLHGCSAVLVTHHHFDHIADAYPICERSGATLVAMFDIVTEAQEKGISAVEPMNIGGSVTLDALGVTVHMVNAQHSADRGHAAGFVIEAEGKCLYFAGDTALFGDMKLYGDLWELDLAVLPVGDRFTMGPASAARAVELLRPRHVIPCHYGTFPIILPDASEFVSLVGDRAEVHPLAPGESLEI
jgi:L-ascorbate metabolism protein UlaG (beta-lactamase superfamily)